MYFRYIVVVLIREIHMIHTQSIQNYQNANIFNDLKIDFHSKII